MRKCSRWTDRLRQCIAALALLAPPLLAAGGPEVVLVHPLRPAIPVYRNSHATAVAWLLDHYGLRKQGEDPRILIATAATFMEFCHCDLPGKPIAWRVREGLQELLMSHNRVATIVEKARYSVLPADRADVDEYVRSIRQNRPVIVTFCYDPDARESVIKAQRRVSDCSSMVGVGYLRQGGASYLVCHDGFASDQKEPAMEDRVKLDELGLAQHPLCSQPGTALYRWDGTYTNLVLTFVTKLTP